MKNIIVIFVLFSINCTAQTKWKLLTDGGKYDTIINGDTLYSGLTQVVKITTETKLDTIVANILYVDKNGILHYKRKWRVVRKLTLHNVDGQSYYFPDTERVQYFSMRHNPIDVLELDIQNK